MTRKRFNKLRMTLFAQMYADAKEQYVKGEISFNTLKGMGRCVTWKNLPVIVRENKQTYQECWDEFRELLSAEKYPVLKIER